MQGGVAFRVGDEPILHRVYRRIDVCAVIDIDAFLALGSVAADVHHHLACHGSRRKRAVLALDKIERHVDARANARARRNPAIGYEQPSGEHRHAGKAPL